MLEEENVVFATEYKQPPPLVFVADPEHVKEKKEEKEKVEEPTFEPQKDVDQDFNVTEDSISQSSPELPVTIVQPKKEEPEKEEELKESESSQLLFAAAGADPPDEYNGENIGGGNDGDDDPDSVSTPSQMKPGVPLNDGEEASAHHDIPDQVKAKMESTIGHNFSNVNIHTNSNKASEVGALAYTQGKDIHFAPGQYNPNSSTGQELLAHELTHVKQQAEGRVQPTTQATNGMSVNDDPALEAEADQLGAKAAHSALPAQRKKESTEIFEGSNGSTVNQLKTIQLQNAPAQAPAPVPDSAVIKSGSTTIVHEEEFYELSGKYREVVNELVKEGEDGSISTSFDDIATSSKDGKKAQVDLTVKIVKKMPNWTDLPKVKELANDENEVNRQYYQNIVNAWNNFYSALDAHEEGHKAIDIAHFTNCHRRLIAKTIGQMDAELTSIEDDAEKLHEEFHEDHGTQEVIRDVQRPYEVTVDESDDDEDSVQYKLESGKTLVDNPIQAKFVDETSNLSVENSISAQSINQQVIQRDGDGSEDSGELKLVFPFDIADATTNGRAALSFLQLQSLIDSLKREIDENDDYNVNTDRLTDASSDITGAIRTLTRRETGDDLQRGEILILQPFINQYREDYDDAFRSLRSQIISKTNSARNCREMEPMTAEMAEAKRQAYENGDDDLLERIKSLSDSIKDYNEKVSNYVGYASRVNSRIRNSSTLQRIRSATGSIADFADKASQITNAMQIVADFATDSSNSELHTSINRVQRGLDAINLGMSFVKAVPVLGALWEHYYYPAATACLTAIGRIASRRNRDRRLLTWISSNWRSPVPPRIDSSMSVAFPGGQAVFSFLWHLFFGNYHYSSAAEEYFMENETDTNAGVNENMVVTGKWNPFVDNHISGFQNWASTNKMDLWLMFYGADLPFPGTGSIDESLDDYNDDVAQRAVNLPSQDHSQVEGSDIIQRMETAFGTSFSNVKIHENSSSASENHALAYTQGNDIHFAPGQFKPDTKSGQELIGHELTHVVQQRQGKVKPTTQLKTGMQVNDDPTLEREADEMGAKVTQHLSVATSKLTSSSTTMPSTSSDMGHDVTQKKDDSIQRDEEDSEGDEELRTIPDSAIVRTGRTNITESTNTYDITGSYREIGSQLRQEQTVDGEQGDASITSTPSYYYDPINENSARVFIDIEMNKRMPNWTNLSHYRQQAESHSDEEHRRYYRQAVAAWERFYTELEEHEDAHNAIDREHFANMHEQLIGKNLTQSDEQIMSIIQAADAANHAYHTTHGATETMDYVQEPNEGRVQNNDSTSQQKSSLKEPLQLQENLSSQHHANAPIQMVGMYDSFTPPNTTPADHARVNRRIAERDAENISEAARTGSVWTITSITNFGGATESQRLTFIDKILEQTWVGPLDEGTLERIWNSFGDGISEVAGNNMTRWNNCLNRGMDPSNIRALNTLRRNFEQDVRNIARNYIRENIRFAREELEKLGLIDTRSEENPSQESLEAIRREELQELMQQASALMDAKARLRMIHVGYEEVYEPRMGGEFETHHIYSRHFDPSGPPPLRTHPDSQAEPSKSWEEVKEKWDSTVAALNAVTSQSPLIYAAVTEGSATINGMSETNQESFEETARRLLNELIVNGEETLPKIDNNDLDWKDLVPIHNQLYNGAQTGSSGTDWSDNFNKSIAQDVIGDHETTEFWISLGLGTAAAAAFIVSELATGGLATGFWMGVGIGLGGVQAVRSWEQYDDLSTAQDSAGSNERRLVEDGQVNSALISAIIDTVFVFLDIAVPAVKGIRAARQAAALESALVSRSASALLENFSELSGREAAEAVRRGISELGVEETVRRSGKTVEELTTLITSNLDEAAQAPLLSRLRTFEEAVVEAGTETSIRVVGNTAEEAWKSGKSLPQALADMLGAVDAGTISREFADRLAAEAVERLGPAQVLRQCGWDNLVKALPESSIAGQRLMQFRDAVYADLEAFIREEVGGTVQRTGTTGNFSNDIDISFTGAKAAESRTRAMEYLARRLGVENSPQAFERTLLMGLFTDPRRIHAYDLLPAGVRERLAALQATKQEQIIWNRRVWEALEAGDQELVDQTRTMMRELGIPEFAYRPLSGGEVTRLAQRVDSLWGQLDEAVRLGDEAAQTRLVEQIGDAQALINAAEEGGYFSAGGVRRYVSERPGEAGFGRLGDVAGTTVPSAERLTAIIDQLPKMDHALLQLSGETREVIAGVRGIGKYGSRIAEVVEEAGLHNSGSWQDLLARCQELKRAADNGGIAARIDAAGAEAVVRDARSMFNEVISNSQSVISQLRAGSTVEGVADIGRHIQTVTRGHVFLLRSVDWTVQNLNICARAIRTGVALGDIATYNPTDAYEVYQDNFDDEEVAQQKQESSTVTGNILSTPAQFSLDQFHIQKNSSKATEMGALAFTQGSNIHFAPGQFQPNTRSGQELIGHEVAHVYQQKEGRVTTNTEVNGTPLNNDKKLEKEADDFGVTYANSLQDKQDTPSIGLREGFELNHSTTQMKSTISSDKNQAPFSIESEHEMKNTHETKLDPSSILPFTTHIVQAKNPEGKEDQPDPNQIETSTGHEERSPNDNPSSSDNQPASLE